MKSSDFIIENLGTPTIPSPVQHVDFVRDDANVVYYNDSRDIISNDGEILAFEQAGPRSKIFHDPVWSRAAILTARGLCPGLNDVIKFITRTLRTQYGVPVVYGIPYGYRGLNPEFKHEPVLLTEEDVELLTTPVDLASYKDAITEALQKGTKRNIVSEDDPKNVAVG